MHFAALIIVSVCFYQTASSDEPGHPNGTCKIHESIGDLTKAVKELFLSPGMSRRNNAIEDESLLQSQIDSLRQDMISLKRTIYKTRSDGSEEDALLFSVATNNRLSCYNCPITFNVVHVNSHPRSMDPDSGKFVAPAQGHYFFQFHALVEAHMLAKVQLVINTKPVLHMYDRDIDGANNRYAMISQSIIYEMREGDVMYVNLLEGALKGGGTHAFTSLIGFRIAGSRASNLI